MLFRVCASERGLFPCGFAEKSLACGGKVPLCLDTILYQMSKKLGWNRAESSTPRIGKKAVGVWSFFDWWRMKNADNIFEINFPSVACIKNFFVGTGVLDGPKRQCFFNRPAYYQNLICSHFNLQESFAFGPSRTPVPTGLCKHSTHINLIKNFFIKVFAPLFPKRGRRSNAA